MDHRFSKRDDGSCTTLCGSPSYFAPEVVRGDIQGVPVDWWGFGVLLYELATGDSPWGATDDDDIVVLQRITSHVSGSLVVPGAVNPQLVALLNDLLEPEVEQRRGDGSVVTDVWFDEISWSRLLDAELPSPLLRVVQQRFEELHTEEEVELFDCEIFDTTGTPAAASAPATEGDKAAEADEDSFEAFHFGGARMGVAGGGSKSGSVFTRAFEVPNRRTSSFTPSSNAPVAAPMAKTMLPKVQEVPFQHHESDE